MSRKRKVEAASYERTDGERTRNHNWVYIVLAVALMISIALVVIFASINVAKPGNQNEKGDLVISKNDITDKVSVYKVKVEGTRLEILVGRDSDGQIVTAFNACSNSACKQSGKGHFKVNGNTVTCKNCGHSFTLDDFDTALHGSQPVMITVAQRKETENSILVPISVLKNNLSLFENN